MNDACYLPPMGVPPQPWLGNVVDRAAAALRSLGQRRAPVAARVVVAPPPAVDWTELDGLSAHVLKDIGAPEWMQQRARTRRDPALDVAAWG